MEPEKALMLVLQEIKKRTESDQLESFYPDSGPLRRELYTKHLAMLAAGKVHNERAALGGNRVGKSTSIGGYETAVHLTGLYPHWWQGHVYTKPILAWAAGTKAVKVRDVNQLMLFGKLHKNFGFTQSTGGMVPAPRIGHITRKSGVALAIDQIVIKHVKGWDNTLTFKSYEEGRTSFEAEEVDWIWLDEEPPKDVYDESKMRILTARGRIMSTFTPLQGMTETIMSLLDGTELL